MKKKSKNFELIWLFEDLENELSFYTRPMFGCLAAYYNGKIIAVIAEKSDYEWNGLLIPTERENHNKIINQFPTLEVHKILPKWLYLSRNSLNFEDDSLQVMKQIRLGNPLFGVLPKVKKRSKTKI